MSYFGWEGHRAAGIGTVGHAQHRIGSREGWPTSAPASVPCLLQHASCWPLWGMPDALQTRRAAPAPLSPFRRVGDSQAARRLRLGAGQRRLRQGGPPQRSIWIGFFMRWRLLAQRASAGHWPVTWLCAQTLSTMLEHKWMCVDSRLCPLPAAPLDPGVQGAAARRTARGGQDHSCEERWLSVHLVAALDPCAQVHVAPMWVGPSHWMSRDRNARCIACSIQMNRSGGTSTRRRWQPRAWRLRCCGRAGTPTLCSFRWGKNFPNFTAFGEVGVAALAFRTLGIVWRWRCGRARAHTLCSFG